MTTNIMHTAIDTSEPSPRDDVLGKQGIDLTSADVRCEPETGLFTYAGRRVLLYRRQRVTSEPELNSAKPFHLLRCEALQGIAHQTHTARHTYTTRRDGRFSMTLESADGMVSERAVALVPCRKCLADLNYRGYRDATSARKAEIRSSFTIGYFFDSYPAASGESTVAVPMPPPVADEYPTEWVAVSRAARAAVDWTCTVCRVRCHVAMALLHTHHINGIKTDLRPENLRVLCLACHRQEPGHQTMYASPGHLAILEALRRQQDLVLIQNETV